MAKPNRTRARARRLYEYDGISQESIAEIVGCSRKSIENWMRQAAEEGDPWVKGKYSQELREKEEAAKVKAVEDAGYDKGRIIAELGAVAFARITDLVSVQKDGTVQAKELDELGEKAAAVKAIKQRKITRTSKDGETETEVTLDYVTHDKLGALQMLGKEQGMFKDGSDQAPPVILSYYRERARASRGKK